MKTTYSFVVDITIPPESNGLCSFGLLQTAQIKVKIFVVEINGGDSYPTQENNERTLKTENSIGATYLNPSVQTPYQG